MLIDVVFGKAEYGADHSNKKEVKHHIPLVTDAISARAASVLQTFQFYCMCNFYVFMYDVSGVDRKWVKVLKADRNRITSGLGEGAYFCPHTHSEHTEMDTILTVFHPFFLSRTSSDSCAMIAVLSGQ